MHRLLLLTHRYLGIALGIVFVLWFASGFAIMYTGGMPALTESERLAHLPDLDLSQVQITSQQAAELAGSSAVPRLHSIMDRPAYEFPGRRPRIVFADNGAILESTMVNSRELAARFSGVTADTVTRVGRIEEVDQWTIGLRNELPLEKFSISDEWATEIYVSPGSAQVVLATTRQDRLLAWLGAIPHWLYFVDLRKRGALWSGSVIWLASLGSFLTVLGLVMLFTQMRRVKPFSPSKAIPYRGLMRWHYLSGLIFGVITLTWVFSGLLSMEPYSWNTVRGLSNPRDALQGGQVDLLAFSGFTQTDTQQRLHRIAGEANIKEVNFKRVLDGHFYQLVMSSQDSPWGFDRLLIGATSLLPQSALFSEADIAQRLQLHAGSNTLISAQVLSDYDNYYYSRTSRVAPTAPLPVLRVQFDDPMQTWYYADLRGGELVYQSHRWGRLERWLYNGLHSLDFGFWYRSRPLWDIAVILLLSGGLLLSLLGVTLGLRRLRRDSRRMLRGS